MSVQNHNEISTKDIDTALIGKQQLLIKSMLSQQNALVAKQQLAIKAGLAHKRQSASGQ